MCPNCLKAEYTVTEIDGRERNKCIPCGAIWFTDDPDDWDFEYDPDGHLDLPVGEKLWPWELGLDSNP